MAYDWTSKTGDQRGDLLLTCTRGGVIVDFTLGTSVRVFVAPVELDNPDTALPSTVILTTTFVSPLTSGQVQSIKSAAFAALPPGLYKSEIEVLWGTDPETFPDFGYLLGRVTASLGA